jgi:hypothetical protein
MVPERIDDSSDAPIVLIADGPNYCGSCRDCAFENRIWILHNHHHPNRAATEGLGAKVEVLGGLVGEPEFGSVY